MKQQNMWLVEYNGKQYGEVEGDNEEEALYSARLKVRQDPSFTELYVNTGFLFVTAIN